MDAVIVHSAGRWVEVTKIPLTIRGVDILQVLTISGVYGVPMFFLLSGYLLTWTEDRRFKKGTYNMRSYALRRVLRLVPAYYVVLLIVALVGSYPGFTGDYPVSVMDVLMHATFLQTLNPYTALTIDPVWWSLTPELFFYCLLPLIILKFRRLWQRLALFGVLYLPRFASQLYESREVARGGGGLLEIHLGEPLPLIQYVHFLPTNYLWLFMAGVLVRMLAERLSDRPVSRLRAPLLAALTLVSALLLLNTGLKINFLDQLLLEMGTWGTIVFMDLVVVVFFATAVLGSPLLRGLLSWRFFGFVGVMSYSLFLLHQMVNMTAAKYLLGDIGSWAENRGVLAIWAAFSAYVLGVLLVAGAISYLSYRFIESPFLRIKPK